VPVAVGWVSSCSTQSWSPARLDGRGCPRRRGLVIPQVAGAQQGLKGGGPGAGAGMYPGELWDQLLAGVRCGQVAGIPVVLDPMAWLRGGYPGVCGSGLGLWPGTVQGAKSPAEWSSSSADLWGRDLAGQLFFC
jgi:hypothetical protein